MEADAHFQGNRLLSKDLEAIGWAAVEGFAKAFDEQLAATTGTGPEPESCLTLDDVRRIRDMLAALPPTVTAYWFVDCPETYQAFLDYVMALPSYELSSDTPAGASLILNGIPLIRWEMRHFDPDTETIARADEGLAERGRLVEAFGYNRVWPWFVVLPGIWAQMSDGSARQIRIERS